MKVLCFEGGMILLMDNLLWGAFFYSPAGSASCSVTHSPLGLQVLYSHSIKYRSLSTGLSASYEKNFVLLIFASHLLTKYLENAVNQERLPRPE